MVTRRDVLQRTALLVGYALSGSAAAGVMAGCRADRSDLWHAAFFTDDELTTVRAMLDHLLPASDTPGATDLFVDRFLDAMLGDYASSDEQTTFRAGLSELDARARRESGAPFASLAVADKDRLFGDLETTSPPTPPTIWGGQTSDTVAPLTFYRHFKSLALLGYFTSEEVGERILNYDPIPGRADGCVPLADIGNAWAL